MNIYQSLSHVGMIIHTTTLDTMEKVIAIYGGTQWIKIEGKFLLGTSSSHAINTTGGEENHTLSIDEMPTHSHTEWYTWDTAPSVGGNWKTYMVNSSKGANGEWTHSTGLKDVASNGGSQPHNNMPPFKTVYIWERTK